MSRTGFDNMTEGGPIRTSDLIRKRASVYDWDEGAQKQKVSSFLYGSHAYSAGGLYSSAADLSRWIAALDSGKLLTQASAQQMWTPQKLGGGVEGTFGVGWVIGTYRNRRTVGHSGGPALADILRFVDDKLTILVLTNQQKMYPFLAQGVADILVPPPPRTDASIPDKDEKTTQSLKALLQELSAGKVDTSRFTPEAQQQFVPMLTGFALPFLRSLEPLRSFDLLEERTAEGGKTVRRYRAWYGNKPIVWMFELTPDGRVSNMSPTPE
jgi:CubicO group peptidase (beta-lactamase class C family)